MNIHLSTPACPILPIKRAGTTATIQFPGLTLCFSHRTHRERKELYIKALEDEVLRLKEIFSNVSNDKQKLSEENKQLKTVLAQNGINVASSDDAPPRSASVGYTSSPSASGHSYAHGSHSAFTPPLTSQSSAPSISPSTQVPPHSHRNPSPNPIMAGNQLRNLTAQQLQANRGVDYEQAGIDFVLTYENHPSKAYLSPPPHENN